MSSTTQSQISKLCTQLREETKQTHRRDAASKLKALVSDKHAQQSLLQEATGGRQALQASWRAIVNSALLSADNTINKSKGKLTKEDILLPYWLLVSCSTFATFSDIDKLLSPKEVRSLLTYALNGLADENSCNVAESSLLDMLHHLCSRTCYVACFRPSSEMNHILSEIEARIGEPKNEASNPDAFNRATKAFAALLKTARTVGLGMHVLIPSCFTLVHEWCQYKLKLDSDSSQDAAGIVRSNALPSMLEAITALLAAHPEQCILEMARRGRRILKLVKRCYSHATGVAKEAIVDYLLAHLLVCETAGRLEGLMPGDLGDVGSASLDVKQISDLLDLIATDFEKMDRTSVHSAPKSSRTPSASAKSRHILVNPVEARLRRHFELWARLLASAQRVRLSHEEWDALGDDPIQEYLNHIPDCSNPEDLLIETTTKPVASYPPPEYFIKSPWVAHVAAPLWRAYDSMSTTSNVNMQRVGAEEMVIESVTQSETSPLSPVLLALSEVQTSVPKSAVPFLQLVCACAETYPLGECWTSNTQRHWHEYVPEDHLSQDATHCNGCSPEDLALVVHLVRNILEAFGGPTGDHETQIWALLCLIRLTESSALVSFASKRSEEASSILITVWQRVWSTVLNSELRYASYTRCAESDSIGELVLILLSEMIRKGCTEHRPVEERGTFVHSRQDQVWSLAAFSKVDSIHVQAIFDLATAVVRFAGLSEGSKDAVDVAGLQYAAAADSEGTYAENIAQSSRRYRLAALCLGCIETHLRSPSFARRPLVAAACGCLLSLMSGKAVPGSSTFDEEGSIMSRNASTRRFCITDFPLDRRKLRNDVSLEPTFDSIFRCLWNDDVDQIPQHWFPNSGERYIKFHDSGLSISRELLALQRQAFAKFCCDFVSQATALDLRTFVTSVLERMSSLPPEEGGDSDSGSNRMRASLSDASGEDTMARRLFTLKLIVSVAAVLGTDAVVIAQESMDNISGLLNSVLEEVVAGFPSLDQQKESCLDIMTDLLQVLRALMAASLSADHASFPDSTPRKLDSLHEMCRQLLNEYTKSRKLGGSSVPLSEVEDNSQNDDFYDDNDCVAHATKHSGFTSESSDSDEDAKASERKRRRSSNSWKSKSKRFKEGREGVGAGNYPNARCASRIALIMILLQPSYDTCNEVAESIAFGVKDRSSDRRNHRICSELDLSASLLCLAGICSDMVLHRKQTLPTISVDESFDGIDNHVSQGGSVVALCFSLIREIRASVGPGSVYYLFGFEVCADLVRHRETVGATPLNKNECDEIISVLLPSEAAQHKALKVRPLLRARQLASTTEIFRLAREGLHSVLDTKYKSECVIPSLDNLCEPVRKQSVFSVGGALQKLPQQENIVKRVKEALPPLRPKNGDHGVIQDYRLWYEGKTAGLGNESSSVDAYVWEGALLSLQAFAVDLYGVVAGSTTDIPILRRSLFELIGLVSERPDLEALAFRSCEKTARLRGFGTVQEMLLSESEILSEMWLDTGKKLADIPLFFTAPMVLQKALKDGVARHLVEPGVMAFTKKTNRSLEYERFSVIKDLGWHVARDFVERSVHFLVPITYVKKVMPSNDDAFKAADYFGEMAEIVVPVKDDKSVGRLIRAHLHDIVAFVEPLLHDDDEEYRCCGEAVVESLKKLVTKDGYEKFRKQNAALVVRRLLKRFGGEDQSFGRHRLSSSIVVDAIKSLAGVSEGETAEDPFTVIGSSITENLLIGRLWLSQSVLACQKVKRFQVLELVCSFSVEQIESVTSKSQLGQLGYCIHTILDIFAVPQLLPRALETLNSLLAGIENTMSTESVTAEMRSVLHRLIGTLLVTHEQCQSALIDECMYTWEKEQEFLRRSMGLCQSAKSSNQGARDVWGWDDGSPNTKEERIQEVLGQRGSAVRDYFYQTLIESYDAITILLNSWKMFEGIPVPISTLRAFASKTDKYTSLARRNPKLCAQTLARIFLEDVDLSPSAIEECVSHFMSVTGALCANKSTAHGLTHRGEHLPGSYLNVDSRLLLDELHCLEEVLSSSGGSPVEVTFRDVEPGKYYSLIYTLIDLCENTCPGDIRMAACRCLGAVGPCDIEKLGAMELERPARNQTMKDISEDAGDHLRNIMSSCMEMLSRFLLSPRAVTAKAALDALKAILSKDKTLGTSVRNEDCKRLLHPLIESVAASAEPRAEDFVLPAGYEDSLLDRAGVEAPAPDLNWCWNEGLWIFGDCGDCRFDEWIKGVTCAMITCCYTEVDDGQSTSQIVRGKTDFFGFCVKLCALEHEFAIQVFPGIVLDLLLGSGGAGYSDEGEILEKLNDGEASNLAHELLSKCFSLLLRDETTPKQPSAIKVISVAIETLDMLRVITQKRFIESRKHRKNTAGPVNQKEGRRRPFWRRAPYGIVLRVNDLDLSRACMQAKRFASALFYANIHADTLFGCSGDGMESLSRGDVAYAVGPSSTREDEEHRHSATNTRRSLSPVLIESFKALGNFEDAGAIEVESAENDFLNDAFMWNTNSSFRADALDRLTALDTKCYDSDAAASTNMQIVTCMEEIGLHNALQTYINGIVADHESASSHGLSAADQAALRDRWFHGCLKAMQWDGNFYNEQFARSPPGSHPGFQARPYVGETSSGLGFHEGLVKSLPSFVKDDLVGYRATLSQVRANLMRDLHSKAGGEAPLRGMISIVENMQLLNDLEELTDEASCRDVALKWQIQSERGLGCDVIAFPRMAPSKHPLRLSETVVSVREVMLRAFQAKQTSTSQLDFMECIVSYLWQTSSIARLVGRSDVANSCVQRLHYALRTRSTSALDRHTLFRLRFEEAMILEQCGDFSAAIRSLKLLSGHLLRSKNEIGGQTHDYEALYTDALMTCGEWMTRYKVEPGGGIMKSYLKPASDGAIDIFKKDTGEQNGHRSFVAHLSLAQLVSGLYDHARDRVETPEFEKNEALIKAKQSELNRLRKSCTAAQKKYENIIAKKTEAINFSAAEQKVVNEYMALHHRMSAMERELGMMKERSSIKESSKGLLRLALGSYGKALAVASNRESSDISRHIYRMVSLWFANGEHADYAGVVSGCMSEAIEQIPTYRFVPLVYQIFSRIGSPEGSVETKQFQANLKKLVFRMTFHHPYHCIVQLLALSNGKNVGTGLLGRGADEYLENTDDAKVEAADQILSELHKSEAEFVSKLIEAYRALVDSYIHLAMTNTQKYVKGKILNNISLGVVADKGKRLDKCLGTQRNRIFPYMPCVLTKPPVISPAGAYGEGLDDPVGSERIDGFESTFSISAAGLSRPKILYCRGSRGGRFKQVIKGGDDVRPDAVMQQVFCYVNDLMKRRDEQSKTRRDGKNTRALKDQLGVVTYNVIPLSPVVGVIEWVGDTIAFGDFIYDKQPKTDIGSHSRYYPGEWSNVACRNALSEAPSSKKKDVFATICKNWSPSFRFFFTEYFGHSLPAWYAAKMKYTRSCAVNSMIGHVLGIGDRHAQNILIREKTGEVVHIDFGVVFEQGKLLGSPETVPFRLSREIVDGMGPCGTEGTFTSASEATTRVLRENANALLTILSAVVSDPLYKWSMTPGEAKKRQRDKDNDDVEEEEEEADEKNGASTEQVTNESADRAISKISEKLQGYEDGASGERQTVKGQVQLLINSARDPDNLCLLFHGWSPWL